LPVVRVAQTIIRAPVQDVANLWWSVNTRKEWDSVNTEDSKLVRAVSPTQRLVYLNGKPKRGGVISSRDFAYAMNRVPPQEVHAHVGSQLFVQVNAPDEEPLHKSSVRGDVNSMLLFEPIDAHTTKVCNMQ
jgi:START domain